MKTDNIKLAHTLKGSTSNGVKKLIIGGLVLVSILSFGFSAYTVSAQAMTLGQLVELLISLGIISEDKAIAARSAVGASSGTNTSSCYNFSFDFGIGSTGDHVSKLQKIVGQEKGTDGVFEEETSAWVIEFQKKNNIRQTGYVGPITRAQLNKCSSQTTAQPVVTPDQSAFPVNFGFQVVANEKGKNNIIEYRATFDGNKYDPTQITVTLSCPNNLIAAISGKVGTYCNGYSVFMNRIADGVYVATLEFTNPTTQNQFVNATMKAYGGSNQVINTAQVGLTLAPTNSTVTSISQPSIDTLTAVNVSSGINGRHAYNINWTAASQIDATVAISCPGSSGSDYITVSSGITSQRILCTSNPSPTIIANYSNAVGGSASISKMIGNAVTVNVSLYIYTIGTSHTGPLLDTKTINISLIPPVSTVQPLTASCASSLSSVNQAVGGNTPVWWSAQASGGSGSYTYSWSIYGDGAIADGGVRAPTVYYGSSGIKQAVVRVTDSSGSSVSANCSATITSPTATVCTADAQRCSDGSYVSRDPNNSCQFRTCPTPVSQPCGGTYPQLSGYTQPGNSYYPTGNPTTQWTYVSSSPTSCQWACANGGVRSGNSCVAPTVTPPPTASSNLTNSITYNTVPALVVAGQTFNVMVTNSGTKTWGALHDLGLKTTSGQNLQFVNLGTTPPNTPKNVVFTAPSEPGTYYIRALEQGIDWFGNDQTITVGTQSSVGTGASNLGSVVFGFDDVMRLINALK